MCMVVFMAVHACVWNLDVFCVFFSTNYGVGSLRWEIFLSHHFLVANLHNFFLIICESKE